METLPLYDSTPGNMMMTDMMSKSYSVLVCLSDVAVFTDLSNYFGEISVIRLMYDKLDTTIIVLFMVSLLCSFTLFK